jgi:hypothetical protein
MEKLRQEPVHADEPGMHVVVDTGADPQAARAAALRSLARAGVVAAEARRAS